MKEKKKKNYPFKVVYFPKGQRSDAWKEWRRFGIGASDISVLMGTNPYSTPKHLWDLKCGFVEEKPPNFAMQQGSAIEEEALYWLNHHLELNLKPLCVSHWEKDHFRASLDGFDLEKKVLAEIKCPVNLNIRKAAFQLKELPEYWIDQVQWQHFLCKPTRAFVAVWDPRYRTCKVVDILPNYKRQESMSQVAEDFWHSVRAGKAPPLTKEDTILLEDEELEALLEEYDLQVKRAVHAEKSRRRLREKIVPYLKEGKKFKISRFKITKQPLAKRYDLKKMETDGVNIYNYLIEPQKEAFALKITTD